MEMQQKSGLNSQSQNVFGAINATTQFGTFSNVVEKSGLKEFFNGADQFTVFAPTNDAFAKLPVGELDRLLQPANKDELAEIVNYHLVTGRRTISDVGKWREARTINGQSAPVSQVDGKLMIGTGHLTSTDLIANNGVIHGLDRVNIPRPRDVQAVSRDAQAVS